MKKSNRTTAWVLVSLLTLAVSARSLAAQSCSGDCDRSRAVTVDELLRGVNIALGTAELSECDAFDGDSSGSVTVDELLSAVQSALVGCATIFEEAFVIVTNFTTGSFGTISLDPPRTVTSASGSRVVHGDAVARYHNGLVYVINRFLGDNIQILDPAANYATRMRCLTGEFTNPQDIAFVNDDKAYVTLFDRPKLLIVDPTPGPGCAGFILGDIDLSAYGDDDGLAESALMAIVGDELFVTLQRLDRDNFFVPSGPARLLVLDVASDQIVDQITLTSGNPFFQSPGLTVRGDTLWISETNEFGQNDGGIERVRLAERDVGGFFITEAELGGDITDFVIVDDHLGYAVVSVSLEEIVSQLVAFDPSTGRKREVVISGGNYADIELNDRGELWVADSTRGASGVRIFRAADGVELSEAPIALGLPPFSLLFIP